MKKIISVILAAILITALLCACDTGTTKTVPVTESPASQADSSNDTASSVPAEQKAAPTSAPAGTLEDYVITAKEADVSFGDGNATTLRLPKIQLNTADANTANTEIMNRFGDDCVPNNTYSPVSMMDYKAFLNAGILSVYVSARYDGGNTYGLCYSFDVTTGSKLDNEALCTATDHDYNTAISTLTANMTTEYDSRYSSIPADSNKEMRDKTFSTENISASKMYLDDTGKLMAMVEFYAAVGGSHWVEFIAAE